MGSYKKFARRLRVAGLALIASLAGGCSGDCDRITYLDNNLAAGHLGEGFQVYARPKQTELTYSFHGFPAGVQDDFEAAYTQACELWLSAWSPGEARLRFDRVESGGDIQIWWLTPGGTEHARYFANKVNQAWAEFPNNDQPIRQLLNGEVASGWPENLRVRVAAHELGHSLGLWDIEARPGIDCGQGDAIMCSWIFSDREKTEPKLHSEDIAAIWAVYGGGGVPAPSVEFPVLACGDVPPPPLAENDDDHDGLSNATEERLTWPTGLRCDPGDPDTDDDGLRDGYEVVNLLDPTNSDSDGDGVDDQAEICAGSDPRSYVVVVEPGMLAVRRGVPSGSLPVTTEGMLALGLRKPDFHRSGLMTGDTATVQAVMLDGSTFEAQAVSLLEWADGSNSTIWLTEELRNGLGLSPADAGSWELLVSKETHAQVTITYPADGDYVPGKTDLIARIDGAIPEEAWVQFFVLAPDPWLYYPQQAVSVKDGETTYDATYVTADTHFGIGEEHDGITYLVWAELRNERASIVDDGIPGFPALDECESQCLGRSPVVEFTRGRSDIDLDCISDAAETDNGTDPHDADDPFDAPTAQALDAFDELYDENVWWWTSPQLDPELVTRSDDLTWLKVDWDFHEVESEWAYISRKFDPPTPMAYCQKVEADVQVFGSQRLKGELKIHKDGGGFDWVRTETFVLEAGTRRTIVIDTTTRWGQYLQYEGIFDLAEMSFTIDRRYDNPEMGTYWIRNIRITGRPCLSDETCEAD